MGTKQNAKAKQKKVHRKANDNRKMISTKKVALLGMLVAVAMIFSYMETFIPVGIAIPGIKLGLANIVTIIVLNRYGVKDAVIISCVRILLSSLLFGNLTVMIYSLSGAFLSILVMWIFIKIRFFTLTGISVLGGVSHNLGQLLVAAILMENQNILYYAPALLISGTVTGIVVGIAAAFVSKSVKA